MSGNPRSTTIALRNEQVVAEILLCRAATAEELARAARMNPGGLTKRVFKRLRDRGLPVVEVARFKPDNGRGAATVYYRIQLPAGRVCKHDSCGTILRRGNPAAYCEAHGGGYLDLAEVDEPSREWVGPQEDAPRTCKGHGCRPHKTTNFGYGVHLCRACYRSYRRDYNERRKVAS